MSAFTRRRAWGLAAVLVAVLAVWAGRAAMFRAAGAWLVDTDPVAPADVAIAMPESGWAGQIELADLLGRALVPRVVVLEPRPTVVDMELQRRGVPAEPPARILRALGVTPDRIVVLPAGEGGTTEGGSALVGWIRAHRVQRVLVITSADHSHRLRRVLRRTVGAGGPVILLHTPSLETFRADTWWTDRRTLRVGLIELQKLLLDVAMAPLS